MNLKEIDGFYGGVSKIPTTIFVAESHRGNWYAVEGSVNVNRTYEDVNDGVWVEELSDFDTFTANEPINSLEQFEQALND